MKKLNNKKPRLQESQNQINIEDSIQQPKHRDDLKCKQKSLIKNLQLSKLKKNHNDHERNTSHRSSLPPISSNRNRFTAIRYKSFDTIRYNKDYNMFQESDSTFCQDVKYICEKNKNALGNIFSLAQKHKNELNDTQCDEIDYIARKHYKANRLNESYRVEKNEIKNQNEKCPCGCDKYRGKTIPFWTSISQLKFLGSGALLIFMFIKTYAIVMSLALIIYGVFALTTNLLGGSIPSSNVCTDNWCRFIYDSANNNKIEPHPMMIVQWWLGLAFSIVWLIATRATKYVGRKMNIQIDRNLASASDNAVLIRKLPQGDFTQTQLMEYFQRLWFKLKRQRQAKNIRQETENTKSSKKQLQMQNDSQQDNCNHFNVQSIQIIYSMDFARKINQRIIDLCKQINYVLETKPNLQDSQASHRLMKNRSEYHDLKEELIEFIEILGDLRNKFMYQENFRKSLAAQLCIVELKTQEDKNQLLEYFGKQKVGFLTQIQENVKNFFLKKTQGSLRFKGTHLKIQRAPEPSDIQWKKCQLQYSTRKTFGLYMLTILIVGISLGLVLALDRLQDFVDIQAKQGYFTKDSSVLSIINIGTSIVLLLVNKFLWWSLAYMIEEEVNYTISERINSRMNKALFATSVNIILLPVITNYVFKVDVYSTKGLTGMVFDYQISTLFIGLPMKLFNPVEILSRLALYIRAIRNWIIRYYCMQLNMAEENHKEKGIKVINNFYEGEYFDVAESYVYIMGTIYHSVFFCQINPAVLVTGTLITIGFFFVLKAKLFYFCKYPQMLDLSVFQTALSQACLVPIIYGAGAIALSYIENQIDPGRPVEYHQAIICMILSFLFFFNPGDVFNKLVKLVVEFFSKIKLQEKKEEKGKIENPDTYYKNSNSLELLGFEKVLKGASLDLTVQKELKRFCSQFIPKSKEKIIIKGKEDQQSDQEIQAQKLGYQKN